MDIKLVGQYNGYGKIKLCKKYWTNFSHSTNRKRNNNKKCVGTIVVLTQPLLVMHKNLGLVVNVKSYL